MTTTKGKKKNPAAVALGRLGGLAAAKVRHLRISPERQSELGLIAINARWAKYRKEKAEAEQAARAAESSSHEPKANAIQGGRRRDR